MGRFPKKERRLAAKLSRLGADFLAADHPHPTPLVLDALLIQTTSLGVDLIIYRLFIKDSFEGKTSN